MADMAIFVKREAVNVRVVFYDEANLGGKVSALYYTVWYCKLAHMAKKLQRRDQTNQENNPTHKNHALLHFCIESLILVASIYFLLFYFIYLLLSFSYVFSTKFRRLTQPC
jgi:hypothetical protein